MRYLSLFDGIGAASVAWEPLGWECVGVSEIDRFPIAVTSHHRPSVPHLGDVTKITESQVSALGHIDLIVGGFPCQDLSVAGKRAGLRNEDGSTTRSGLFFDAMRIVQWARKHCGLRYLLIENVPGLYSSNKGRDFAAVVGEMVGTEFDVPRDGWRNAGFAIGPEALCEWATLDAQFFNVAQRRVRVFALADFGDWSNRPPILLEPDSLRGDSAPSREAGQKPAGTFNARTSACGGFGTDFECDGGLIASPHADLSPALKARDSKGPSSDGDGDGAILVPMVAHTLRGEGFDASDDGTGRGTPLVPVVAPTLRAGGNKTGGDRPPGTEVDNCESLIPVVAPTLDQRAGRSGETSFATSGGLIPVAIRTANTSANGHGIAENVAHTLDQAQGQCVAFMADDYKDGGYEECDTARPLTTSADRTRAAPIALSVSLRGREGGGTAELGDEVQNCLRASGGGGDKPHVLAAMQVRRLTPVECSRLQGFQDDYLSQVPWRGKTPPPDGPMYKALGNSMAVPVMRWIGEQIEKASKSQ